MTRRAVLALLFLAANPCLSRAAELRSIIDMADRTVALPEKITRIITVGPVPVLNSFVFAFGKQAYLLNGPPLNLRRFQHQEFFAPGLDQKPIVQGADMGLSFEDIIALNPGVVLAMDAATVSTLEKRKLPAVYLRWSAPEDIRALMRLLGDVFGEPRVAEDYVAYFDEILAEVERKIVAAPNQGRPRVLFVILQRFTQPHRIADWWITKAGGRSVTDNGRSVESFTFSFEQMLAWDPEILIVANRREVDLAYSNPRLKTLAAVRARRVFAPPAGAMPWSNRTVEQPLTVLWAATLIHPELFDHARLKAEAAAFYERFFHVHLSPEQIDEILAGIPG